MPSMPLFGLVCLTVLRSRILEGHHFTDLIQVEIDSSIPVHWTSYPLALHDAVVMLPSCRIWIRN